MTSPNALAAAMAQRPAMGGQPPRYQPIAQPMPVAGGAPPGYVGPPQGAPQPVMGGNPPGYQPMQPPVASPPVQGAPVGPVAPYQPMPPNAMRPPMFGGQSPRPQMQAANNFAQAMQGGW
jgi:hypothetical protein